MSEYLGTQKINRSAVGVKTAERTNIYLGVCEQDKRPVRFEFETNRGAVAMISCYLCGSPVQCKRLVAVETTLDCDSQCRGARLNFCSCGCGGINHGDHWSRQFMLDHREVYEDELERYRAEQIKIKERRAAKAEAKANRQHREFEEWAADNAEAIAWLMGADADAERSSFVGDMIRKLQREEILSPRMLEVVIKIHGERAERAAQMAVREAERAARDAKRAARGAGNQDELVPGVYKLDGGEIYVVKGNQAYNYWRKSLREAGIDWQRAPKPADCRLYAKKLVESPDRMTEADTMIPFELEYAKGVIYDLALEDRMSLAEAEQVTTKYAQCIVCGRTLKAGKSVRDKIGPVCIKYFGPVGE